MISKLLIICKAGVKFGTIEVFTKYNLWMELFVDLSCLKIMKGWTNFSLNMLGYLSILGEKYIPLRVGSRKIMNIILLLYKFTSLDCP